MTIRKITGAMLLLLAGYLPAQASYTICVSSNECITIALQENPTIRVADMEV